MEPAATVDDRNETALRKTESGPRYRGRAVVIGLGLTILALFAAVVIMSAQIGRQRVREHIDLPNTPHRTGALGFPPPPPDMTNPGTTRVPAH